MRSERERAATQPRRDQQSPARPEAPRSGSVIAHLTYVHAASGRRTTITDLPVSSTYAYDAAGELVKLEEKQNKLDRDLQIALEAGESERER